MNWYHWLLCMHWCTFIGVYFTSLGKLAEFIDTRLQQFSISDDVYIIIVDQPITICMIEDPRSVRPHVLRIQCPYDSYYSGLIWCS